MALLTRAELKELDQFLRDTFRSEVDGLVAQVRDAVKDELKCQQSLSPADQVPKRDKAIQNKKDHIQEIETEDSEAERPSSVETRQAFETEVPVTPVSKALRCRKQHFDGLPTLLGSADSSGEVEVKEFSGSNLNLVEDSLEEDEWDTTFDKEVRISNVNVVPIPRTSRERRSSIFSKGAARVSARRSSRSSVASNRSDKSIKTTNTWDHQPSVGSGEGNECFQRRLSFLSTRLDHSTFGPTSGRVVRVLDDPVFDMVIAILIVLNGVTIGVQTEYMATNLTEDVPAGLRAVEISFCVAFTGELLLRILVEGRYFAYGKDWAWNMFDSLVVMLQLMEEAMGIITAAPGRDRAHTNFSFMRIFRVLRLIRIVRVLRVLRLIGELRLIVTSIASSMRHLFWTVMLLILMIYTLSVGFTQLVLDHRLPPSNEEVAAEMTACWSSIGRSSLTLFESITGGMDWDVAIRPLARNIHVLLAPLFCLYIAFTLLALMNVVTGVFVENAIDSANRDKERYLVQTARELFERADPDGAGVITWSEFERQLARPALQEYLKGMGVDTVSAKGLFKILDLDNSGAIDAEELITGTLRLRGHAKAIDLAALIYESRRTSRRLQQHMRNMERCTAGLPATSSRPRSTRSTMLHSWSSG